MTSASGFYFLFFGFLWRSLLRIVCSDNCNCNCHNQCKGRRRRATRLKTKAEHTHFRAAQRGRGWRVAKVRVAKEKLVSDIATLPHRWSEQSSQAPGRTSFASICDACMHRVFIFFLELFAQRTDDLICLDCPGKQLLIFSFIRGAGGGGGEKVPPCLHTLEAAICCGTTV